MSIKLSDISALVLRK